MTHDREDTVTAHDPLCRAKHMDVATELSGCASWPSTAAAGAELRRLITEVLG